MPTINLGKKKKRDRSFAKIIYQDIYQDKRWKRLVAWKLKEKPTCERCTSLGLTSATKEVHHKIPFDWGRDDEEKETLAFDYDNLESLCTPCHNIRHIELKNH